MEELVMPVLSRRRFLKSVGTTLAAGATALSAPGVLRAQGKKISLSYISFGAQSSIWSQPYFILAKHVADLSNNEVEITWGGGPEVVAVMQAPEAVRNGAFDIVHTAPSYYASAMPEAISMSSGLASGPESLKAWQESGLFAELDAMHRQKLNVALLGIATSGVGFAISTKEEPKGLESLRNKRFRSLPIFDPIFTHYGAAPVTVGPTEVYSALERGLVDGYAWPLIAIAENGFHEHAKYLIRPGFYHSRTQALINLQKYESLPADVQQLLAQASRAADDEAAKSFRDQSAAEIEKMKSEGLVEFQLPEAEAAEFLKLTEELIWAKIVKDSPDNGPKLRALFDKTSEML
jgi:TRAP-type C4-dicarboxylate transport system substrate-binding protein